MKVGSERVKVSDLPSIFLKIEGIIGLETEIFKYYLYNYFRLSKPINIHNFMHSKYQVLHNFHRILFGIRLIGTVPKFSDPEIVR